MRKDLEEKLTQIIENGKKELRKSIKRRISYLKEKSPGYYALLEPLGITSEEGKKIDMYHNTGRILFARLGGLLEDLTVTALTHTLGGDTKFKVKNRLLKRPKHFEIDWLYKKDAYEIKWRYATTAGNTVRKLKTLPEQLNQCGYTPVFVVYFKPILEQPLEAFEKIATSFKDHGGDVYVGYEAWEHIKARTEFDLKGFILSQKNPPIGITELIKK